MTFVGPVMVDGFAVSEQPDGVPAAGSVAASQVNVEPTRLQLHTLPGGSAIVKPAAWAGVTSAGAANTQQLRARGQHGR